MANSRSNGGVVCRRDVTFVEDSFPFKDKEENRSGTLSTLTNHSSKPSEIPEGHLHFRDPLSQPEPQTEFKNEINQSENIIEPRRSSRPWTPSEKLLEHIANNVNGVTDPKDYKEAMASDERSSWISAMESEVDAHVKNQTMVACVVPPGRKPVPLAWVFRRKINPDGTLRHKARIVMKGFLQKPGVDFNETFAPVARWTSIRLIFALSATFDFEMRHIDFDTAFMIPEIDAEIYVKTSQGMETLSNSDCTARMMKGVPGCKQGSRLFYEEISRALDSIGLKKSLFDPGVFYKIEENFQLIILTWVDDFLIVGGKAEVENSIVQ